MDKDALAFKQFMETHGKKIFGELFDSYGADGSSIESVTVTFPDDEGLNYTPTDPDNQPKPKTGLDEELERFKREDPELLAEILADEDPNRPPLTPEERKARFGRSGVYTEHGLPIELWNEMKRQWREYPGIFTFPRAREEQERARKEQSQKEST